MDLIVSNLLLASFCIFLAVAGARDDCDGYLKFLGDALRNHNEIRRRESKKNYLEHTDGQVLPKPYKLPGDYSPLPGRTTNSNYWPLYPLMNQYMSAVTFDTSKGRVYTYTELDFSELDCERNLHTGVDMSVPVPWWGFLDMNGHVIERVQVEANTHIDDGVEGELELPVPISKSLGYRVPVNGNVHYDKEDISLTYGQSVRPVDPFLFVPDQ